VFTAVLWVAASLGFSFYVANFQRYNQSYGTIGGVIVLMMADEVGEAR
jgi:membrane protein